MAVFKTSMNGFAACKKLGITDDLLAWLQDYGMVKLTPEEFIFSATGAKAQPTVKVTVDLLQALVSGQTKALSYQFHILTQSIKQAIKTLKDELKYDQLTGMSTQEIADALSADSLSAAIAAPLPQPPATTLDKLPGKKPALPAAPPVAVEPFPAFPADKMHSAQPVQLRNATQMYQPVKGSSANSDRYFVVAANQDLRIAARLCGGTLSIRIEGPAWEKHQSQIKAGGFDKVDVPKGYASLHLGVGADPVLAGKTLGAVIMGLGLELQTPVPNLKLIAK